MVYSLQTVGKDAEITYNGFTFEGPFVESTISATPIPTGCGRAVKQVKYLLEVRGRISWDPDGIFIGTDPETLAATAAARIKSNRGGAPATVRDCLTMHGGTLIYKGQGVGQITVNTSTSDCDIEWGPKVLDCKFRKLGASLVHEVTWAVEFYLPECRGIPSGLGNVKSYSYEVSYQTDDAGNVARTISGMIEISLNRSPANGAVPGNAPIALTYANVDEWLQHVKIELPLKFRRGGCQRKISSDKTVLTFSVTDHEIESPNAYPTGIRHADMTHSISFGRSQAAFQRVHHHIQGSFEAYPDYGPAWAWSRAFLIMQTRIAAVTNGGLWWPILQDFQLSERIFGEPVDFSCSWVCIPRGGNNQIANQQQAFTILRNNFNSSGLFSSVDTDWAAWQASGEKATNLYGQRGMKHDVVTSDKIYTLCNGPTVGDGIRIRDTILEIAESTHYTSSIGAECPPPTSCLLDFQNVVEVVYENGVVQKITMGKTTTASPRVSGSGPVNDNSQSAMTSGMPAKDTGAKAVTVQSGGSKWKVRVAGFALSLCHDPPVPQLNKLTVNGTSYTVKYVEGSGKVRRFERVGVMGHDLPIHRKEWEFELVPDTASGSTATPGVTAGLPTGFDVPSTYGYSSAQSGPAGAAGVAAGVMDAINKILAK